MLILIVSLIVLAVVAAVAGVIRNRHLRKQVESGELEAMPETVQVDSECCGQHEVCEKESLLAAVSKKIEYYDDEELDRFRGTPSDGYNDEDADAFREVLYTMRPDDVPGWVRSLQLRGVSLPDGVKDEIILIVDDLRAHPVPKS